MGCADDSITEVPSNPCDTVAQGFTITQPDGTLNGMINDNSLTVQYVTGNPQGDYYHIFSNGNPTTDFYTFAVNSGDTSTLDQNWNTTAGSFLSYDGVPLFGTPPNNLVISTVTGGSQVGDLILLEFAGDVVYDIDDGPIYIEGQYCVTIDEVTSPADYVYVTDGANFKIINVFDPFLLFIESSTTASTSYFVEVIDDKAFIGYYDAVAPFLDYYDVSDVASPSLLSSISKGDDFGRLSDIQKVGNLIYSSDELRGVQKLDFTSNAFSLFENHDVNNLSLIDNELVCLGIWGGLYQFDVSTPNQPLNTNYTSVTYTDIDIASYPGTAYSFHSWVRNDGNTHYVANIDDQKLKQINQDPLGYTVNSEVVINGYATALELHNNFAFITTRPSAFAPLQTSFDGITMVHLGTMSIADTAVLNNASGVVANQNLLYVTDTSGLHIYDISQGTLDLLNTYPAGNGNYISLNQ